MTRRLVNMTVALLISCFPAYADTDVGLAASDWKILYSKNLPSTPSAASPGWVINMRDGTELDYVTRSFRSSVKSQINGGGSTHGFRVRMKFDGTPDNVTYRATEGGTPAVTIMLRKGNELYASNGRMWCRTPRMLIQEGTWSIDCPLIRANWGNVDGQTPSSSAFSDMLKNGTSLGITFGGMFFGHGVKVRNGTSKFQLLEYTAY